MNIHKIYKTLYKYAYSNKISGQSTTRVWCVEIDNFIIQEIQNRQNLIKGMTNEELKQQILESIPILESLQTIGTNGPSKFNNYNKLSTDKGEILINTNI